MKIRCDVCEGAEAALLCCSDEAALCWACDDKIHAANKLASKHQRVPLLNPSSQFPCPKCDICQEKSGYFFCLEDRALFCRQCDVSVHTASPYVTNHQRFLVTGVKVGLHHHSGPAATPRLAVGDSKPASSSMLESSATGRSQQQQQQPDRMRRHDVVSPDIITAATMSYSPSGSPTFSPLGQHWAMDGMLAAGPEFDQGYVFSERRSSGDSCP